MHLCMILEEDFGPIPEGIELIQSFGDETVVRSDGSEMASGKAVLLSGDPDLFISWLEGKTIWHSANPLTGVWEKSRVKGLDS